MNLRKDHYRIFVRINFRQKKQRCIHLCLQTERDFGFARRSARLPRELWFLAVRYCRRRRITHGLGSLMWTQWGLLSSMFARKGRQCFKHSFQCHGVPVPEFTRVSGRAPIARGLTRLASSCAVRRFKEADHSLGVPRYSHPASPPRDTTPVFSFHNCYLSMTTFMVVARSFRCPGVAAVTFFSTGSRKAEREKEITLSGGSLGSCVDEERSQLRELM